MFEMHSCFVWDCIYAHIHAAHTTQLAECILVQMNGCVYHGAWLSDSFNGHQLFAHAYDVQFLFWIP